MGIGCQVDFARCDTGIQLSQPVTPVTKTLQYRIQVRVYFEQQGLALRVKGVPRVHQIPVGCLVPLW